MLCLLILIPFLSVIILNLPLKKIMYGLSFWFCFVLGLGQILLVTSLPFHLWNTSLPAIADIFKFNLVADSLSLVMLACIAIVVLSSLLVARCTIKDKEKLFNFFNLLLITLAGMNALALVNDIFSLYVFVEVTAVATFILIAANKDANSFEAAFKYIVLSSIATILILASIALLLLISGDTNFLSIKQALLDSQQSKLVVFAIGIFICGLFIKAGVVPFHGWLPDAYSAAPAPVSVLLAGIVTKSVGVYTLIRLITLVFGFENEIKNILLFLGAFSIVFGALAALGQSDFKRMLAYSSISQVGYIIIGLGVGTPLAVAGAVFHFFNHAIFKSSMFVNAAAVEKQVGTLDMDKISGLSLKMPVTTLTLVLTSLSAAGIPPLSGFWSKLLIIIALWVAGLHTYAFIAILASVLTLAYFLSLQRRVFFGKLREELKSVKEAEFALLLPAIILSLITLALGVAFPFITGLFAGSFWNFLGA